jgi:hypothetical protein
MLLRRAPAVKHHALSLGASVALILTVCYQEDAGAFGVCGGASYNDYRRELRGAIVEARDKEEAVCAQLLPAVRDS